MFENLVTEDIFLLFKWYTAVVSANNNATFSEATDSRIEFIVGDKTVSRGRGQCAQPNGFTFSQDDICERLLGTFQVIRFFLNFSSPRFSEHRGHG